MKNSREKYEKKILKFRKKKQEKTISKIEKLHK